MQLSPFFLLAGTFESWDLYSIFIDFFYSSTLPRKPVQCRLISSLSLLYLSLRQPSPSSPFSPLQPPPVCAYRIFALNQKPKLQRNSRKRRRQQKKKKEVASQHCGTVRNKTIDILEHCKDWAHFFTWIYFFTCPTFSLRPTFFPQSYFFTPSYFFTLPTF